MILTFLGTNTLFITKDDASILVDPHFSRPSLYQLFSKIKPDKEKIHLGLKALGVKKLNGVLLTHTHYDHALDAAEVIDQVGGTLYGSESAVNLAKGAGFPEEKFQLVTPNMSLKIGNLCLIWLEAQHIPFPPPLSWFMPERGKISQRIKPPLHFWKYQTGTVFAILIDHLLVLGSAGLLPEKYQNLSVETIALSVGGLETKSFRYLKKLFDQTVIQTGAKKVLLSHWDNFFQPISQRIQPIGLANISIRKLTKLGAENCCEVKVLIPGEQIAIE
jgi:L-ascorbate metabolism protein UlaG (beta-lactamase superfamily)